MLQSPERDQKVEFVADQLKRVQWISGYEFVPGKGYLLEWLPVGSHRMMLLQIALRENKGPNHELERLDSGDVATAGAIRDFWTACTQQLALREDVDALPAFVNIIEGWKPR